MSGQPAIGDTFTIEPASAPAYTAVPTAATGLAIGIPRVADPALADPTHTFAIQFTSPTAYDVVMSDGVGNVSSVVTCGVYDPLVSNTLTFEGMEFQIYGTPVVIG